MEEKLAETLEVKAQLEAKSEADQAKILHLESKLVQLSLSESTSSTSKVGDRKRVEELRKYKEALKTERHALEHILNHGAKPDPLTCHLCKPGSKFLPIIASEDHEKRLVEIDVLFEAIDEAIDMKNAIIVGHQHPKVEVFFYPSLLISFIVRKRVCSLICSNCKMRLPTAVVRFLRKLLKFRSFFVVNL